MPRNRKKVSIDFLYDRTDDLNLITSCEEQQIYSPQRRRYINCISCCVFITLMFFMF